MSLAPLVRILGRGPGRSRPLTRTEAELAMTAILSGAAEPEAVGALLMLMRYRGEVADEVAGFVEAMRATLPKWNAAPPSLDWPSYAAGRTRGVPLFLLSAKLVASSGASVLLHGWNSHQNPRASVRDALSIVGIASASSANAAVAMLAKFNIAYLPLESISPKALELLKMRDKLGLRSAVNTVLRVLNPAGAAASVQGVFHPSYRGLQSDTGALLGQPNLTIIKGGGGEFERHPAKDVQMFGLRGGTLWQETATIIIDETRRLSAGDLQPGDLARLWSGELQDPFAEAVIVGTAALALETIGTMDGMAKATKLWQARAKLT